MGKTGQNLAPNWFDRTIEAFGSDADVQSMAGFSSDLGRIAGELPEALVILEPDGTIAWVNQASADLMALGPGAWLGRSVFELVHEDDHAAAFAAFESVASQQPGSPIAGRVMDGTGSWRQLEIRGRMVPATSNADGFAVVVLRDTAEVAPT